MYKKGTGNDRQGKDAGNRTLCPYRNFSLAIMLRKTLASKQHCTMQEGTGRYVFIVKDGKLIFGGLFKYILSKLDKIF